MSVPREADSNDPFYPGDRIGQVSEQEVGETRVVSVVLEEGNDQIVLHRSEEGYLAYLNRCRHLSVPLDYGDGDVVDESGKLFQCRTHGALFRPRDGLCVSGPCHGLALHPVEILEKAGGVYLAVPEEDS